MRCAKRRLFFTTGSHGSWVLNSAPYSPCWYTRDFLFQSDACHGSQGPEFCTPHARFCRWVVFRGVPGINNVIIGAVPALCENAPQGFAVLFRDAPPSESIPVSTRWMALLNRGSLPEVPSTHSA